MISVSTRAAAGGGGVDRGASAGHQRLRRLHGVAYLAVTRGGAGRGLMRRKWEPRGRELAAGQELGAWAGGAGSRAGYPAPMEGRGWGRLWKGSLGRGLRGILE